MSKRKQSQAQTTSQSKTDAHSRQNTRVQPSPADALLQTLPALSNNVNALAMETLQQQFGNDAVSDVVQNIQRKPDGTIQRGILDELFGNDEENESDQEQDPEEAALQEFLDRGMMPNADGQNVIGAGGLGGFNAKFDPESRALIVTVNVGINFHHALGIDPTSGVVYPENAWFQAGDASEMTKLVTASTNIMTDFPDISDRVNEVNTRWRWSSAEEDPWMAQYRQAVEGAWGGQHYFQSQRWDSLQSNVRVNVNVHKGSQDGDHCSARILKTPPEAIGAYVSRGTTGSATDQGLFMSSSGVTQSEFSFLRYQLRFPNNSSDLTRAVGTMHSNDAGPAYLNKFIADFQAADPTAGNPIQVIGRASATGDAERNRVLGDERATAVEQHLRSNGLNGSIDRVSRVNEADVGAGESAAWRRVDIIVGSGEGQNTAAHEFGHMIGLGDEYSSPNTGFYPGAGTPVPVGNQSAHHSLAQAMGGGVTGALAENSDSMMSVGNTVRPQHYATFHKAIEAVTSEQWEYGGSMQGTRLPAAVSVPSDTAVA